MDYDGLVNIEQTCGWIIENPKLGIYFVSNGTGTQPTIEEPSNDIFK